MALDLLISPPRTGPHLTVGLVNNMPDGAFTDTEEQFRRAVSAGGHDVDLELYTIMEIPRCERVTVTIEERYRGLDELWSHPPDALIVTGTEPTEPRMRDEPYWPHLARLLEWAADAVPTVLLSCLASHASILLFDGIDRRRRPTKCSGVFRGEVRAPYDPLAVGLPDGVWVPHSRINEVPEADIAAAGYRVVIGGDRTGAGWAVAARECGNALFVLCQGHPEYSTLSLLREYRRDVRRFLRGRGAVPYPRIPDGYLTSDATAVLEDFALRALASDAEPEQLLAEFPYSEVVETVDNKWVDGSMKLYANWLQLARAATPTIA
jgi:homoserine O-succinyltransferase/O-acetyltransferase